MDKGFNYSGWDFTVNQNGDLTIQPGASSGQTGESQVFGEPKNQPVTMQSITIPHDDVYRLIGYLITRDTNNTQVLSSLRDLEKQHGLVTTK